MRRSRGWRYGVCRIDRRLGTLARDGTSSQARLRPPAGSGTSRRLRALVLEAPYTSLLDARTFPSGHLIRALPYGDQIMLRWFYYHFPTLRLLPSIVTPTLILHGTDVLVPFQARSQRRCLPRARCPSYCPSRPRGCGHLQAIFHLGGALASFFEDLEQSVSGSERQT